MQRLDSMDCRVKPGNDDERGGRHAIGLHRRELIALLGGAVAMSTFRPLAAHAQPGKRVRRVGVLMNLAANDPEAPVRIAAFAQGLQEFGWIDGGNLQIDVRWGAGEPERFRRYASELTALAPDVILAAGGMTVAPLLQATRAGLVVFVSVIDPVGAGFVASLARPRGNAIGFTRFEYGISRKWLELLKQIAPSVTRVAVLRDPAIGSGIRQFAAIQSVAPSFGMELRPVDVRDAGEMERAVAVFAGSSNGGLIVTAGAWTAVHRDRIVAMAARHRLPAAYARSYFVSGGGLVSYGPDAADQYRRAAGYVDRILRGEKLADPPRQAAVKYELVINLKTAKALGLDVPPSLLVRADEVIER
jgi:putative ABC transport system substrate-binding protein